jgi:hypothetical protein
VAGYPEAHPDRIVSDADEMKKNYWADIHYLKEKVSPPPPPTLHTSDGSQSRIRCVLLITLDYYQENLTNNC